MLSIGDKAPGFELVSDQGKQVKLSGWKGTKMILYFFPKAGTSG